jgi:hypothetical protein
MENSHFKSYPIRLRVSLSAGHAERELGMRKLLATYVIVACIALFDRFELRSVRSFAP